MKITEAYLRSIVKSVLLEAPLADLDEPYDARRPDESEFGDKALQIFKSRSFKERLTKLLSKFPQNIWVSPVVKKFDIINFQRVIIGTRQSIEPLVPKNAKEHILGVMDAWLEKSGGTGTLIIPISDRVAIGNELTPWMILHAMFDSNFIDPPNELKESFKIAMYVEKALDQLEKAAFGCKTTKLLDNMSEEDIYKEHDMIEKMFTFGSARKGYFSGTRRGRETSYLDVPNEAAVQSILSTGFKYDRAVFEEFKRSVLAKESGNPEYICSKQAIEDAEQLLQRAEKLSAAARSAFIRKTSGKIIIVGV